VGATKTAAAGPLEALTYAAVSCSNWAYGFFHPYHLLSKVDDLDFVVHCGGEWRQSCGAQRQRTLLLSGCIRCTGRRATSWKAWPTPPPACVLWLTLLCVADYIYEYEKGVYPSRHFMARHGLRPKHRCTTLDDYRQRYACYRRGFP
jgi:phosphodiesterase/alkaline phosphatase D-like protein